MRVGIRAGGLRRDERIYSSIFDTKRLFGQLPRAAITDKSSADGVIRWISEFFGFKDEA